jgi:hypothetical protein
LLTGKREGKTEEKRSKKGDIAGKSSIEENSDKKGTCLNCTKGGKLTAVAYSLRNKRFYCKSVPHHHKMHIPEENSYACHVFSTQTVPLTRHWMILNSRYILNFVNPASANNRTAW